MTQNAQPEQNLDHEPLYLVDGSGFIFRAYHALPPLNRPDGTPVNAVLGFTNMLTKLLMDLNAHSLAVIFDAARYNFRNEIYSEYKANRSDPPEDLVPQFALIREAVQAFNLPCLEMEGFEADDLIATYARLAREQGRRVVIVSSDKDLMQLLDEDGQVTMLDAMKNREIGLEEVIEKFGVPPSKVVDVQALTGDSIDNVPGVPGIGIKTAAQLIGEYGSLDALLDRAEEIKQNKRRESLIEHAEMARLSRQLVRLDDHVPVPVPVDDLHLQKPDGAKLLDWLQEQGFRSTIARVGRMLENHATNRAENGASKHANGNGNGTSVAVQAALAAHPLDVIPEKPEYILINDAKTLQEWVDHAVEKGVVAIDTETTDLTPAKADMVGISMCFTPKRAAYIPLGHTQSAPQTGSFDFDDASTNNKNDSAATIKQLDRATAIKILKPMLENPAVLKIGHNMKYDWQIFANEGVNVAPIDDTMLLSYILDGGRHGHGMDELAELFCGHTTIKYKDVVGTGKAQIGFAEVPIDRAVDYAAEDADITLRLHREFKPRLVQDKMTALYETIERPLVPVVARMELAGIKVDPAVLKEMSAEFQKKLAVLEEAIHAQAGQPFNVASPKQLGEILFDQLGLQGGKKSKTGVWSTAVDVLEPLAHQGHKIVADVLEWRQLAKLKSTYTDALQEQIAPRTGRVHSSFMLAVTNTGRLSSTDPNLQNIPIRTEDGRRIRTAFVAEAGHKLISIDYSQIELRLVAEMAGIAALREAFREGLDIHAHTASQVFGVPMAEMTSDIRRKAKAINFGIIYGISGFGLSKQLGCEPGEAKAYIDQYLKRFPELADFMEQCRAFARKNGYVETLFGRKCFVDGIHDKNPARRQFAERQAINAPLQGTAADIMKRAMIRMQGALDAAGLKARMLLQVHDELIFEAPEAEVEKTIAVVRDVMENAAAPAVTLSVPLVADAGVGDNWAQAH